MRIISYLFLLAIIILGISFATLNSGVVTINYYLGQKAMPLSLLIAVIFALGCLLGGIVGFGALLRTKFRNYRLQHQLTLAELEINNLRAIPLQDKH